MSQQLHHLNSRPWETLSDTEKAAFFLDSQRFLDQDIFREVFGSIEEPTIPSISTKVCLEKDVYYIGEMRVDKARWLSHESAIRHLNLNKAVTENFT